MVKMYDVTPRPAGLEQVRFIAADMDGTLLTPASKLPENFADYVEALASVGCEFAIASGRPLHNLVYNMGELSNKLTFISDNGAIVTHHGEVIYQRGVAQQDILTMAKLAHSLGDIAIICGLDTAYVEANSKPYEDYFHSFYTKITYVDNLEEVEDAAVKFTIYYPQDDAFEHLEDYRSALGEAFDISCGNVMWTDIQAKGINKGSTIERVSKRLGIELSQMAAFGDAFNDADMLKTVGFGYMMANAMPGLDAYARYVAPSNAENGVLQVLDQVIAARKEAGYDC